MEDSIDLPSIAVDVMCWRVFTAISASDGSTTITKALQSPRFTLIFCFRDFSNFLY